mmetsp:Transcript_17848/g.30364  ORF Transcript_17848/g.30364 Transcript_17848/m.30364 type:complete len:101 (-) Transcript_17848:27-329(-)
MVPLLLPCNNNNNNNKHTSRKRPALVPEYITNQPTHITDNKLPTEKDYSNTDQESRKEKSRETQYHIVTRTELLKREREREREPEKTFITCMNSLILLYQ